MGKWRVFALRAASSLIWGGGDGGWLFHFFLSKIVALVQVKGAGVPAAHPHPEILKVPPGTNPYISNVTQQ